MFLCIIFFFSKIESKWVLIKKLIEEIHTGISLKNVTENPMLCICLDTLSFISCISFFFKSLIFLTIKKNLNHHAKFWGIFLNFSKKYSKVANTIRRTRTSTFLIVKYNTPIKGLYYTEDGFSLSCGICFHFSVNVILEVC